jgi:hypothetical protein
VAGSADTGGYIRIGESQDFGCHAAEFGLTMLRETRKNKMSKTTLDGFQIRF